MIVLISLYRLDLFEWARVVSPGLRPSGCLSSRQGFMRSRSSCVLVYVDGFDNALLVYGAIKSGVRLYS